MSKVANLADRVLSASLPDPGPDQLTVIHRCGEVKAAE